jgi:hypothetical protein
MAFWFFLIHSAYVVIWLITGALDTIPPSLLGLMEISVGAALNETLIDSGKDSATPRSAVGPHRREGSAGAEHFRDSGAGFHPSGEVHDDAGRILPT